MPEPLRLMAVFAHPDDESLGLGGTLARYAAEGVETYLVTATRGEGGRFQGHKDPERHPGPERLAVIREAELRAAAQVLGLRDVALLGYPDGKLDQADPDEILGKIAAEMRRVRPQVVVTFGPDGAYGHPDHVAICQFASAAIVVAADPARTLDGLAPHGVSKLYYMVSDAAEWEAYQTAFKRLTSTVDGVERQAQAWPEWQITTVVDTSAHWEKTWAAVQCHDSQIAGYETLRHLSPEHHAALWSHDQFYRAMSTVNGGRRRETDLFEGLRDGAGGRSKR